MTPMSFNKLLGAAALLCTLALLSNETSGRGFGGYRGGGFNRGGGGFERGGFNGGGFDRGGFAGGGFDRGELGGGGFDRGGFGGGEFGAGGFDGGGFDRSGFGAAGASPSRSQLNSFLGMPFKPGGSGRSSEFNVQHGAVEGPRGGYAAGATVEGPRGGEAARGVAVGANGGVAAGRGAVGPNGAAAGQGIARGPNGRVAGGSAVRGPNGGAAGRGFVAGPNGVAVGYARVSPSNRYACAAGVRGNFNHYGMYRGGWYGAHPGAWAAAGWAAGTAWNYATWPALGVWLGYGGGAPLYNYSYGDNVVYDGGNVLMGDQVVGTSDDYFNQASTLAGTGAEAPAEDASWLPLGVFAFGPVGQKQSNITVQLAVNKQGVIRGNYTDNFAGHPFPIQGAVDKKTQLAAWTVGDNKTDVFQAGLYNLTKPEVQVLVHFGKDRTEQWLLVRLKQPAGAPPAEDAAPAEDAEPSAQSPE